MMTSVFEGITPNHRGVEDTRDAGEGSEDARTRHARTT